jgi:fumarate reductase flavoprotein subunit
METQKYDLIIMGGGLAGLSAGVRACELGLSVALVEKGDTDQYPCNSRFSGGVLHLAFQNIKSPADQLAHAIGEATSNYADAELVQALSSQSDRCVTWLQQQGARFIRAGQVVWQQWIMAPPRPISPGMDWKGRGPDVTLRALMENFRKKGGHVFLGWQVTELISDGERCLGFKATREGQEKRFESTATLVADGGFQANLELLKAHIAPQPHQLLQRGAGNGMGDGMRLAQGMGAATSSMEAFYGHVLCQQAFSNSKLWPYPQLDELATSGVVVNQQAQRVIDEGIGGVYIANQLAHRANPLDCHVIFDQAIWDGPGKTSRIPANPLLLSAGATLLKGQTWVELAQQMGLPEKELTATMDQYNQAVQAQKTSALQPPRSQHKHTPMPVMTAPFYALPVCAGITYTTGGLLIDAQARVLRDNQAPIPGLYAAGSSVGGIEGGPQASYVGGLMKALVFGILAAEDVSKRKSVQPA